jgi:predicted  nucleic acid-binding Zn-ribbon protein
MAVLIFRQEPFMLREDLKVILDIQELDIQMIRLMRLKRERESELERIRTLREELKTQVGAKESDIIELKKQMRLSDVELQELKAKISKLEGQQSSVKKVEEFNALTQEISSLERERASKEARLSDLIDRQNIEEDLLKNLKNTFEATKQNSQDLEKEIRNSIVEINNEGIELKKKRDTLQKQANGDIFFIYEKLLKNKKDRIVVPIENRCCAGCHILVTAQHENIVRKGEKLTFCEHCSRIHFWPLTTESVVEEQQAAPRRRRRVSAKT